MKKILIVPDTQVKEGVPIDHIAALGQYCVRHTPEIIVHLGDHWDMPSLSSYDKGKLSIHGKSYMQDIRAGCEGMAAFDNVIDIYNAQRRINKQKLYRPRKVFLIGNHEERILRHVNNNPELKGLVGYWDFNLHATRWEVHPFLSIVNIEGIRFSHYFINPDTVIPKPFSGSADLQLTKLGFSFIQGHRQGLQLTSPRFGLDNTISRGIILGSFYQHDETYMGPQGNEHYRGALMLTEVDGTGWFSPIELSIDYLLHRQ